MRKILLIVNDYRLSQQLLDTSVRLAKAEKATLICLLMANLKPEDRESYFFPNDINLLDQDFTSATDEEESRHYEFNLLKLFEDTCKNAEVSCGSQLIEKNYLDALLDHSAFADMMICNADSEPQQYSLKSLLADAHCPALLLPEDCEDFDKVIFTYDGHSSSMQAIRMFTYLFSHSRQMPVRLVSVIPTNIKHIEYNDLIQHWLELHYQNAQIEVLKGEPREELVDFIKKQPRSLVVMGAYGRSALSRLFKESLAKVVIEKTNAPIFIAHD